MPVSEKSVVSSLIKKIGCSPYHICYITDDMDKTGEELRRRGYIPMGEPLPAPALGNVNAAFYYHRQMGILEIFEEMQM